MYWIERDGMPVSVSLMEWAAWMGSADLQIGRHDDPAGWRVSTVFLGTGPAFEGKAPRLYETMVFDHPNFDEWCWRHATRAEAVAAHARIVAALAAGVDP